MKKAILLMMTLALIATHAHARVVNREVAIQKLHPIAAARSGAVGENITRVYVNSASWGGTSCRQDAGDLTKEDTHLLSILLWAMSNNAKIVMEVDDTRRPVDTVCRITALFVTPRPPQHHK